MAQVSMSSTEYLELVDMQRELAQLKKDQLAGVEIEVDEESSYNKIRINITPVFAREVRKQIIQQVISSVVQSKVVMKDLVGDNKHFLDLERGSITYNWNDEPEDGQVDLLQDKTFKAAFEAAKRAAEEGTDEVSEEQ